MMPSPLLLTFALCTYQYGTITDGFHVSTPKQRHGRTHLLSTVVADEPVAESAEEIVVIDENSRFDCDDSVAFWRSFRVDPSNAGQMIQDLLRPYLVSGDAQARAYWLYHTARVGYFTGNAVAGLLAHRLHDAVASRQQQATEQQQQVNLLSLAPATIVESLTSMDWNYKWVEKGVLNYPWDAALRADKSDSFEFNLGHRQSNPLFALQETARLVQDSIGVLSRRDKLKGQPAGVWLNETGLSYPSYYLNDFHYQQDGWMSSVSAERYEVSTETLFVGRQDSMQRQTIVPIRKRYGSSSSTAPESILEVACGTGRYATFARDNFPTSKMTLVDLSPFYLEKARENDVYWRKERGGAALQLADSTMESPAPAKLVQANAEDLPFDDNSFEVVTTVYLFHELPHEARVNVAKELARVCRPGGLVVLTDSWQVHDTDTDLSSFSRLNEPHYLSYIEDDLGSIFTAQGLDYGEKYMNSRTKTLTFYKP